MRVRFAAFLTALLLALSFASCGKEEQVPKSEYLHTCSELAMNLPARFLRADRTDFDAVFTDGEAFVCISRFSFYAAENDDLDGSMFPDVVAEKYVEKNSLQVQIVNLEEYSYFTYTADGYYNLFSFYRSKYAHFIIRFMCEEEKEAKFSDEFSKYADEVIFTQ